MPFAQVDGSFSMPQCALRPVIVSLVTLFSSNIFGLSPGSRESFKIAMMNSGSKTDIERDAEARGEEDLD